MKTQMRCWWIVLPPTATELKDKVQAAPAMMLNSRAILSSGLHPQASKIGRMDDTVIIDLHLPATEDEALLWRNYFLFDWGDLQQC
jgi:hypothetical protein